MFNCSWAVILERWKQCEVAQNFSLQESDAVSLGEHSQHSAWQTFKIPHKISLIYDNSATTTTLSQLQQCHNSKSVIFQEKLLKVLKCYNFLWPQRRQNCSPTARFANCVMTLYLLKVHLQTFLSIRITQKWQILSCDTLVANEWYVCWELLALWHSVTSQKTGIFM
jgi:hypothetical protein